MFYDKFEKLCAEKQISKQYACSAAGLSGAAWVRWANGSRPSMVSLHKLCTYFGVTADSMADDSMDIVRIEDGTAARQAAFERADLRVLFDAAKDLPASKIYEVVAQLQKYKEESDGR